MNIAARKEFSGQFTVPGDKSITHRAILFNAAAEGEAHIAGALLGEDCLSSASCMRALGAKVEISGADVRVIGTREFCDAPLLDCGNSGTTMRLLMGLLAGRNVHASLTGDASLSARPMERVARPLRLLGAEIGTENGHAPVTLSPARLHGCFVQTQVASAQVKSAVILAALGAAGETVVEEPLFTRDHTERMLAAMGADILAEGPRVTVRQSALRATDVNVPADISSAAYFLALGALRGEVVCKNVGVNPTRTGLLRVFDKMGVRYRLENERTECGEPVADIRVFRSPLRPLHMGAELVPSLIDELPVIAVLCAFAEGESVISGAEELKVKESDRIAATSAMLNALGGDCTPTEDGFIIRGKKTLAGGRVRSLKDHRIAMSGAVALAASERGGSVEDAECVNISFPGFYEMLAKGE